MKINLILDRNGKLLPAVQVDIDDKSWLQSIDIALKTHGFPLFKANDNVFDNYGRVISPHEPVSLGHGGDTIVKLTTANGYMHECRNHPEPDRTFFSNRPITHREPVRRRLLGKPNLHPTDSFAS